MIVLDRAFTKFVGASRIEAPAIEFGYRSDRLQTVGRASYGLIATGRNKQVVIERGDSW
jgi:hypothetical protein